MNVNTSSSSSSVLSPNNSIKMKKKLNKDGKRELSTNVRLIVLLSPFIVIFFFSGIYLGGHFLHKSAGTGIHEIKNRGLIGLPGTNNIHIKWGDNTKNNNLRGVDQSNDPPIIPLKPPQINEILDIESDLSLTPSITSAPETLESSKIKNDIIKSTPKKEAKSNDKAKNKPKPKVNKNKPKPKVNNNNNNNNNNKSKPKPQKPKYDEIEGDELKKKSLTSLSNSLRTTSYAYMKAPETLDNENLLVGAWIYLDTDSRYDHSMRTIFSNKKAGCEKEVAQNGISMYVNAWDTKDHKLYVEYGGVSSGCNKLSSVEVTLNSGEWYHVAAYFSSSTTQLFIDGNKINSEDVKDPHKVQTARPLIIGRFDTATDSFPFFGNISHLSFVKSPKEPITTTVKNIMDVPNIEDTPNLYALYKFTDTAGEVNDSPSIDTIGKKHGKYAFKVQGFNAEGVKFALVDGIGNRPITDEMKKQSDKLGRQQREKVKAAMKFAWDGYRNYAWGRDELKPISKTGQDNWGGMGVTLVDSLDTLWIMGMKREFAEARDWVAKSLTFQNAGTVSVFETTIRELGGLLSAYDLSGERVFLDKANELARLLLPAFNTKLGIPRGMVNFKSGQGQYGWAGDAAILSELGSLQLEFRYLAQAIKDRSIEDRCMKALQVMSTMSPKYGLFPIKVSIENGNFADSQITFGALGDSFYEYLLKVWIQGGKKEAWLREMYDNAMDGVITKLLQASSPSGLAFVADLNDERINRKMDHLVCFLPGTMALGAYTDPLGIRSSRAQQHLSVAKALMYTCREMYHRMASGISAEFVEFPEGQDFTVTSAPFYILRPETAESLFVLNQLTGDPVYREWAWEIFQAIEANCKTEVAYGALSDVTVKRGRVDDRMESFFLAETLKYLYLVQDPDKPIDLMQYVFNTEAHPTKIFDSSHQPVGGTTN